MYIKYYSLIRAICQPLDLDKIPVPLSITFSNLDAFIFFCNSITGIGIIEINSVIPHCIKFNGTSLNMFANIGIMTTIV